MNQLKQKFIASLTANPLLLEIDKFQSNPWVFLVKSWRVSFYSKSFHFKQDLLGLLCPIAFAIRTNEAMETDKIYSMLTNVF